MARNTGARAMHLPPDDVCADIRALVDVPATEPVTVRLGRPAPGFAIPRQPEARSAAPATATGAPDGFQLDMARVEAKLRDTAEVAALLSGIFEQEDDTANTSAHEPFPSDSSSQATAPRQAALAASPVGDLDAPHSGLLRALQGQDEIARAAFDDLAAGFDLLPDGAIDQLNETALEMVDAPVLEDGDPLQVDREVLAEVLA